MSTSEGSSSAGPSCRVMIVGAVCLGTVNWLKWLMLGNIINTHSRNIGGHVNAIIKGAYTEIGLRVSTRGRAKEGSTRSVEAVTRNVLHGLLFPVI